MRDVLDCACPRLDDFLTRWYGKPDREARPVREADQRLPRPLQECFEVMTRWSRPLTVQNRLLDADQMWVDDGKQVFWVENQGVWLWGIDPVGADPAVYDRENEPGQPWEPTGVPLSVFLVQIAVFEAIAVAEYGAGAAWIKPEDLEKVLAPLTPIPGAKWRFPETMHQLYGGDDLLAQAGPNVGAGETPETAEYREVFVAGRIPSAVAYLQTVKNVEWDWHSWPA